MSFCLVSSIQPTLRLCLAALSINFYLPKGGEAAAVCWALFIGFDFIADAFEDVEVLELQQFVWHGEGYFCFLEV